MYLHDNNECFVPEFGRINQRIAHNEEAWHKTMQAIADGGQDQDFFEIDLMCRYAETYSDAQVVGYVLATQPGEYFHDQQAAYRGMVFAHFLLKELTTYAPKVDLDSYWDSYVNQPKPHVQHRLIHEASDYIRQSESVDRLLCRFMPELSPRAGKEYIVEVGAALVLRQAELEEVLDEQVNNFAETIVDYPGHYLG